MSLTIKLPAVEEFGTIEDSHSFFSKQQFLNTTGEGNPAFDYASSRFLPTEELPNFFSVENLYEWLQQNCNLDKNDIQFINLKLRNVLKDLDVKDIQELGTLANFNGQLCRDVYGLVHGLNLRIIPYNGKNNKNERIFLKFFYNKIKNTFEVWYDSFTGNQNDPELEGQKLNAWREYSSLLLLRNYSWNISRKTPLNLNETIFVTEGIYDSIFLNNSICAGGMVSTLVIPEQLQKKNLIFIIDNQHVSGVYHNCTNLLKMGYSVFKWPKQLEIFKDFSEYAQFLDKSNRKFTTKYDDFVTVIKNNIKTLVFSEENIFKGGDTEAYDQWFFNKYS
jgi:hypothetical protein